MEGGGGGAIAVLYGTVLWTALSENIQMVLYYGLH